MGISREVVVVGVAAVVGYNLVLPHHSLTPAATSLACLAAVASLARLCDLVVDALHRLHRAAPHLRALQYVSLTHSLTHSLTQSLRCLGNMQRNC